MIITENQWKTFLHLHLDRMFELKESGHAAVETLLTENTNSPNKDPSKESKKIDTHDNIGYHLFADRTARINILGGLGIRK